MHLLLGLTVTDGISQFRRKIPVQEDGGDEK